MIKERQPKPKPPTSATINQDANLSSCEENIKGRVTLLSWIEVCGNTFNMSCNLSLQLIQAWSISVELTN